MRVNLGRDVGQRRRKIEPVNTALELQGKAGSDPWTSLIKAKKYFRPRSI